MAKDIEFLAADGYLDPQAFKDLAREIDKYGKKEGMKPTTIYFTPKSVPAFDKKKAKADPDAYEKKRAQPVKTKSREPAAGSRVKMVIQLRLYKGIEEKEHGFSRDIKEAIRALESHGKKAEKTIEHNKKVGAKLRERGAKEFDKNLESFEELLQEAGVEAEDIAIGTSMMGKTMILRLPNGGYVSIGKSDEAKFNKAQESGDEEEEAAPKKKAKKSKEEAPAKKKKKKVR